MSPPKRSSSTPRSPAAPETRPGGRDAFAPVRPWLTGASSHATRLTDVEKALEGKAASADNIEAASRIAGAKLDEINSDIHASSEYRRAMTQVFCERALKGALARVG